MNMTDGNMADGKETVRGLTLLKFSLLPEVNILLLVYFPLSDEGADHVTDNTPRFQRPCSLKNKIKR